MQICFSIMHFHISCCKSEAGFRPPNCEFQLFSFAYKTIAKLIETTLGGPHRHRNHLFRNGVITFSTFLEINNLDVFQGGSIEAPSLSFMPCAKVYKNLMKLVLLLPNVLLRGMQNIEMIEITQEVESVLPSCISTYSVASRRLDFDLQLAIFTLSVLLIKHIWN